MMININQPLRVFVYGTLKPQGKYYQIYCQGKTIKEEKCWTKGELFALSVGYPAMVSGNDRVYGFLLTFASLRILDDLDKLEGYSGRENAPQNEYERVKILVYDQLDQPLNYAWAYFMKEEKVKQFNGIYLPSGWWEK